MAKSKATVVVNLDPEAQAQWRAALEERDTFRTELERIKRVNQLIAERAAGAEAERDAARAELLRLKRLLESLPAGLLSEYAEAQDD